MHGITRRRHRTLAPAALCAALAAASHAQTITLEVDLTDLPRNMARSTMTVRAPEGHRGPLDLYFVVWSPGNHTPSGPVENIVDLRITGCDAAPLRWDRDPTSVERITVHLPDGCDRVGVSMGYIASQPNVNSRSTDTYGRPGFGVLNWNTVLLYPAGMTNQEITVAPSAAVPASWGHATALPSAPPDDGRYGVLRTINPAEEVRWLFFETVTLARLVDSPLIAGRHLRSERMDLPGFPDAPPHTFSVVASEESLARVPAWLMSLYARMCEETMALFAVPGRPPFPRARYDFLIALDDSMRFGVEHADSTLIALPSRIFADAERTAMKGGGRSTTVIPHEYFHTWCGKLVAPEGLVRDDFHTPARTELLWVYEGLTSYYDTLLAARAGLLTAEEYRQGVLDSAVALEQRAGRLWRSVEDTARSARFLRHRGLYWYDLRRGQEYYGEGAKFWMEADALIRRASAGERSLDDFCRVFFDVPVNPPGAQATYAREGVVRALRSVEPSVDWDGLIRLRIEEPARTLDMGPLLRLLGWRVEYGQEPTPEQRQIGAWPESGGEVNLRTSLGLRLNKDAEVIDIVPGSPADGAGIGYGMRVIGVGGAVYTPARLREAVKDSPRTGAVELLIVFGERIEPRRIAYDLGARIPRLVRDENEPDILSETVRPLRR